MRILSFISRSLAVSVDVTLRMIIVLGAAGLAIFLVVSFLGDEPLAILFIFAISMFPGLVFLYLSAIRAGLVAMDATGPPTIKKLANSTIRLFRFCIMINNLLLTILGIGGSILFIQRFAPEVALSFREDFSFDSFEELFESLALFWNIPIGIAPIWAFAVALSVGVIGTPSGAMAATAAEKGPTHDLIWGVMRQYVPLFMLTLLVLLPLAIFLVIWAGGPLVPLAFFANHSANFYIMIVAYILWAGSAISAGMALAYIRTIEDIERERIDRQNALAGVPLEQEELRALRLARQSNQNDE